MWLWGKRAGKELPQEPTTANAATTEPPREGAERYPDVDHAIETIAHALRVIGRAPLDGETDDTHTECEQWAQHVLVGRAPPGRSERPVGGRREWGGVRAYFTDRRRKESDRVARTNNDLRELIWSFVQKVNESVGEDEKSDHKTRVQLDRLRHATTLSVEDLKQEVLTTIHAIGDIMQQRAARHRAQTESLSRELNDLTEQLNAAKLASAIDPLTQLTNRSGLEAHLLQTQAVRNLFGEPACVAMIDLDHFKKINDTYGHIIGDTVIKRVAHTLALNFPRRSDCVSRYGGEEFALVMRDATPKEALRLIERMMVAVRALKFEAKGTTFGVTCSVGLAPMGRQEKHEETLQRADAALYQAKQQGRDRVITADDPNATPDA